MLGLLLIYWIGRYFYNLAIEHNRNKWFAAIGGVVAYYAGTFIAGIIIALVMQYVLLESFDDLSDIAINFMALPVGLLTCYITYVILKRYWSKKDENYEILDAELLDDNDLREL